MKHFEPTRIRLLDQRVPLEPLLHGADQVVTHGGQGLIASALASGVPLLLIPHAVEQYLSALQVRKLGAGVVLDIDHRERHQVAQALGDLLDREEYRRAAQAFALAHESFDRRGAARKAAGLISGAAGGL
jgi:UDP:flavonoid glycosyltransferase YjiC (YdhE family)